MIEIKYTKILLGKLGIKEGTIKYVDNTYPEDGEVIKDALSIVDGYFMIIPNKNNKYELTEKIHHFGNRETPPEDDVVEIGVFNCFKQAADKLAHIILDEYINLYEEDVYNNYDED